MLFKFRRMRAMDPLQVAMTGVRMGEKCLQVFCCDLALTQGLATKTGLSGAAALAAPDGTHAARARGAASKAGALIESHVGPPASWPWSPGTFDLVVVDNTGGDLVELSETDRASLLDAAKRVLRAGGRLELIERVRDKSSEAVLHAAGLKPVRTLAEKDGFRFIEGLNTSR